MNSDTLGYSITLKWIWDEHTHDTLQPIEGRGIGHDLGSCQCQHGTCEANVTHTAGASPARGQRAYASFRVGFARPD